MKNNLTAVDWLINKVEEHFCLLPVDLIEQAKAMEKEDTIEFANKVLYYAECSFTGRAYLEKGINELYKEEYEK